MEGKQRDLLTNRHAGFLEFADLVKPPLSFLKFWEHIYGKELPLLVDYRGKVLASEFRWYVNCCMVHVKVANGVRKLAWFGRMLLNRISKEAII